jgi:hypothetical protein
MNVFLQIPCLAWAPEFGVPPSVVTMQLSVGVRPHPGPLPQVPQERENLWLRGERSPSNVHQKTIESISLSLGERAGVRAVSFRTAWFRLKAVSAPGGLKPKRCSSTTYTHG